MQLRTNDKGIFIVKVDPSETFVVEFCPDGINELLPGGRRNGKRIGFTIDTMFIPGGKMALRLALPGGRTYRASDERLRFILCDLMGYNKATFECGDFVVELEKVE